MIYLLDVAKIVTIPLIHKALGLPRAICYSGLHFGPCKIRYSEEKTNEFVLFFSRFFVTLPSIFEKEFMRPLILISNDDGYEAKGINSLVDMVRHLGDVLVCAPEGPRSGMACAFSATEPLTLTLRREEDGVQVWSCNGHQLEGAQDG